MDQGELTGSLISSRSDHQLQDSPSAKIRYVAKLSHLNHLHCLEGTLLSDLLISYWSQRNIDFRELWFCWSRILSPEIGRESRSKK